MALVVGRGVRVLSTYSVSMNAVSDGYGDRFCISGPCINEAKHRNMDISKRAHGRSQATRLTSREQPSQLLLTGDPSGSLLVRDYEYSHSMVTRSNCVGGEHGTEGMLV